jgi:hypothetical protein
MPTSIFIVIFARDKWWIDLNGKSQGPFLSRETAISEATRFATELARAGKRSEVQVAEPGQKTRIVYQSAGQSLFGKGAALVSH